MVKEGDSPSVINDTQPVILDGLSGLGVGVNKRTSRRIERGEISGAKIELRKKAAEVLKSGIAKGKDNFFLDVAYTGLDIRDSGGGRNDTEYSQALRYDGFTEAIAEELEINPDTLQKLLKAVRADIIYEEFSLDPKVSSVFTSVVEAYLSDFLDEKHKDKSKAAQRVQVGWHQTIRSFYASLFDKPEAKNAAWVPYEIEFLATYVEDRIQRGSPLTTLDRVILEEGIGNADISETLKRISRHAGIPIGSTGVISTYRHLLIFGSPIKAEIKG